MIRQHFVIPEYGWEVFAYYNADNRYADMILDNIDAIGVNEYQYIDAQYNLTSRNLDRGLCYSNYDGKVSVLVISDTSSPEQFFNSFLHEIKHLERHIERTFGIDPYGEEATYLTGKIGQLMFPKARYYLCRCHGRI